MITRHKAIQFLSRLSILPMLFSAPAYADQMRKMLEFRCDPFQGEFVVIASFDNAIPDGQDELSQGRTLRKGKSVYVLGVGSTRKSCRIGGKTIRMKVWYPTKGKYLDCKNFGFAILEPNRRSIEPQLVHNCMGPPVVELHYSQLEGWRRCEGDEANLVCKALANTRPVTSSNLSE